MQDCLRFVFDLDPVAPDGAGRKGVHKHTMCLSLSTDDMRTYDQYNIFFSSE